MLSSSHAILNQENYKHAADAHNEMGLNSTLYLAYRDIPAILERHLFGRTKKESYRLLDFGCGVGLSTEIIAKMVMKAGYKVDVLGVDVSEENLKFARHRLPKGNFLKIEPNQSLQKLGEFDLIVCNFVLVELQQKNMLNVLKIIQPLLIDSGALIVTNCTSKAYKRSNKWYSFNNNFPQNEPTEIRNNKPKFQDDQPIKVQIFTHTAGNSASFTFFDFFHSGKAYRSAYEAAGLQLLETHKPIGRDSDGIPWRSEKEYSPYKIHVLYKQQPKLEMDLALPPVRAKL